MTCFVGLDVSQKMTAICVVDNAIWLNGRPLLASSPTASRLNSSVN